MNEEILQKNIADAEIAKSALNHPLIKKFFEEYERTLKDRLWDCPVDDVFGIKALKEQAHALRLFKGFFEEYIYSGKFAEQTLEQLKNGSLNNI